MVPKTAKVDTADTARSVLDWTRRMLDTGTQLEEVVVIVNHSYVVDDEGVRAAWMGVLRPNVVVRVEGRWSETVCARLGNARVEPAQRRETFYDV